MEQRHRHRWPDLRDWKDPLTIVIILLIVVGVLIFVVGYGLPSPLLQALGAILFGAGVSALVAALTGREAIHQQSSREANLRRKRDTYGPLYAELKALRAAFFPKPRRGTLQRPLWTNNDVADEPEGVEYLPSASDPTLKRWPEFRRDYRDTDFTEATQALLDEVQALATTYNNAVAVARPAAIRILAPYVDAAISAERQTARHQDWKRQQAAHAASEALAGQELRTAYDWFSYFEDTLGYAWALPWLRYWPGGSSLGRSRALGWLLAGRPDKAASYVQRQFPAEGARYPRPLLDWIQPIFEQAFPELQQDAEFRAAVEAGATLFQRVQVAAEILADELRRIQKLYEGGEPRA